MPPQPIDLGLLAFCELTMRKAIAALLAVVGLILAVGVPITIALLFNLDPGKKPGLLVGGMMPGVSVLVLARKLWKGGEAPKTMPDQVRPGYQVCDLCGNAVLETEGVARRLDLQTPMARVAFVCYPCTRYRTRRALLVLVLFLAALGVFALVVHLTIPNAKKK
jgi:hypothetical protein